MHNSLSVRYFILTVGKTFGRVDRLTRSRQPLILARQQRILWAARADLLLLSRSRGGPVRHLRQQINLLAQPAIKPALLCVEAKSAARANTNIYLTFI
ncbi:hypothetical protein QT971_28745 [Microcoleus sp. herbarium19]|uniref:hypothetical protein n=1 Tax=unclassified Microcoleus TaxID=2642155 RepID=UPI002FD19928